MGLGLRVFLVDPNDSLKRLPVSRYERLLNRAPEESLPQYANNRVRYILAVVDLLNRRPVEILRLQCSYLSFDSEGKLAIAEFDREARLAIQSVTPLLFGRQGEKVINARHRFAKRRFENEYLWMPSPKIKEAIIDTIF